MKETPTPDLSTCHSLPQARQDLHRATVHSHSSFTFAPPSLACATECSHYYGTRILLRAHPCWAHASLHTPLCSYHPYFTSWRHRSQTMRTWIIKLVCRERHRCRQDSICKQNDKARLRGSQSATGSHASRALFHTRLGEVGLPSCAQILPPGVGPELPGPRAEDASLGATQGT